jgi:catechol 2,3-dioxygenase-like lactoylglutathione lyase family enzyme
MTEKTTRITKIGRVIIPVSDQDQALEFYMGKLGFEKRLDAPYGEGERWIEVAPPGAATTIALVPGERASGGNRGEPGDPGRRRRPCRAAGARSRGRRRGHAHGGLHAADVHVP